MSEGIGRHDAWSARVRLLAVCTATLLALPAMRTVAQPLDLPIPPATTTVLPPGITIRQTAAGMVYADARGLTLYGMDFRMLGGRTGQPAIFCRGDCAKLWEPLVPPPSVTPVALPDPRKLAAGGKGKRAAVADWIVVEGAQGPQWLYKGWHLVFTRRGDRPGSTRWDGSDGWIWNTLKYVRPVPEPIAPTATAIRFVEGDYAFATREGLLLYSMHGRSCTRLCDTATPFKAGLANQGLGDWTVSRSGDVAQWVYQGRPVFVAEDKDSRSLPKGAVLLRP